MKKNEKESKPSVDLFGMPVSKKRGKTKDPFSIELSEVKLPSFDLESPKKKKGKKKDSFSIF